MQHTVRQVISDVTGGLKSFTLDDRISKRLVLSKLIDKTYTVIKQDTDSRRLFKTSDIWKKIDCFCFEKDDKLGCADIPHCEFILRSKSKLPKVFQSSYGDLVKLLTLDGNKEYKQTTLVEYKDIKNREYQDPNQRYFWIIDDYVYIPDSDVKCVMVLGLFKNPFEVTKLNEDDTDCLSPLDEIFQCPDYLLDIVKTQVGVELANMYKRMITDERSDLNSNQKV